MAIILNQKSNISDQLLLYESIVNSIGTGIKFIDQDGFIRLINDKFLDMIIKMWNQIKTKLVEVLSDKFELNQNLNKELISDVTHYIHNLKQEFLIGTQFHVSNFFFLPSSYLKIIAEEINKLIITPKDREKFSKVVIPYSNFYDKNWISYIFTQQKLKDSKGNHIGCFQTLVDHTKQIKSKKIFVNRIQKLRKFSKELEKNAEERIKKLAESEKRYRILSEGCGEVIITSDFYGNTTYVSPSIKKFSGYSVEEYMSLKRAETETYESFNAYQRIQLKAYKLERQGKIKFGRTGKIETEFKKKDGTVIEVETVGTYLRDESGKPYGHIRVMRDISERKGSERALIESQKQYKKSFESSNFFKDILSHDINNILNNINLAVDLLSICEATPTNIDNFQEGINVITRSIRRGESLISTVRKLSKIEDLIISIKPINAGNLLNEAIKTIKNYSHNKIIDIQVLCNNDDSQVKANELLLDVFENILGNALKYNISPIVKIEIKITDLVLKEIKYLKFEFIDNGIGIPDSSKETIMKEGYKKENNIRGLGIGLSLVKKAIESYQGKFWVEDKIKGDYAQGSIFVILIPKIDVENDNEFLNNSMSVNNKTNM